MRLTIDQQIKCIVLGIGQEEYRKKLARFRRLTEERLDLIDAIEILENSPTDEERQRLEKKKKRLAKVEPMITELKKGLLI